MQVFLWQIMKLNVAKPFWSRESGEGSIFDTQQNIVDEDRIEYYQQSKVYQKYLKMLETTITSMSSELINFSAKWLLLS
ncbi:hypothetical protein QUF74_19530 [Candidatus Halobeggiatoa sp. HSG11]|nr:hypothetical protein [Candidatus Halobeggiatoa sp. HSG11]